MSHISENDHFELKHGTNIISIDPVYTPGHLSDHLCFIMREEGAEVEYSLFTGDTIIGSESTFFTDYPLYF